MYTIYAKTHFGVSKEFSYIDKEYALEVFARLRHAQDMKSVDLCDGLTGEVLATARSNGGKVEITYYNLELLEGEGH